jgi:hypothetical protein
MAKRKDIEITGGDAAANPNGTPEPVSAKSELPTVESPPISPGTEMPAIASDAPAPAVEPVKAEAPAIEPIAVAAPAVEPAADAAIKTPPRFVFRPRHKRYALLAASVTFAAALGAVIGALASGGFSPPARPDVAAVEQDKAMQQSIAKLGKEITTLKASLEQANKSAHTQIAKITERLEHGAADITGSISAPQTVPAAPPPLPTPRPAPRIAAMESQASARVPVVADWTIHDTRNGYVFVESHGEIYQVQLGAPLPGLGPVQSVKRQDGRWVVLTPKGVIVSMRDRRYFEEF